MTTTAVRQTQLTLQRLKQLRCLSDGCIFPKRFYALSETDRNVLCTNISNLFSVNHPLYPVQRALFVHLKQAALGDTLRAFCDFVLKLDLNEWNEVATKDEGSDTYNEFRILSVRLELVLR